LVRDRGGEVVWAGRPGAVLVGGAADQWDMVALVRYPSSRTLVEMDTTPEYQIAVRDREAGLERTILIACTEIRPFVE
jgi:hypothetical protein